MRAQHSMIGVSSFVATTILLYGIGHIWAVPWLMFHYEYQDGATGLFTRTGSFIPALLGLAASFLAQDFQQRRQALCKIQVNSAKGEKR